MKENNTAKEETQALAVVEHGIVMPAVSAKEAIDAWKQYEDLKRAVAVESDYQLIEGKKFLKKSYWRKIATFFNLNVEIVEEHKEQLGKTLVWHFTAKATAPNGRCAVGTGSCDAFEKAVLMDGRYMIPKKIWSATQKKMIQAVDSSGQKIYEPAKPNSIHNIRTTAETRSFNRAISNLIGGGEVSAEEVQADTEFSNSESEKPLTTK